MSKIVRIGLGIAALAASPFVANGLVAAGEYAWYGSRIEEGRQVALYALVADPHDPHQRPRLALAPGARARGLGFQASINSLGFRGPELSAEKQAPRIWCAGGGTVYDIFAPSDGETWPAQLQSILRERTDQPVEVLNAGVPGEVMVGSVDALKALAPQVGPDVLVIYHGPNDLRAVLFARTAGPPMSGPPLPDYALFRLYDRLRPLTPIPDTGRHLQPNHMDDLRRRFEVALRSARELGVEVVLASHGMQAPLDGAPTWDAMQEEAALLGLSAGETAAVFDAYNELVQEIARREGVTFADVRAATGDEPARWGDAIHFAPPGSRAAAEAVADAILDAQLL